MPDLEIRTERLILDRLVPDDAADLFAVRSNPDVRRFQGWAPDDLDAAVRFIEAARATPFGTLGTWSQRAIRERETGAWVGDLGVRFPDADDRTLEIGITIAPSAQRRGYACEALTAILDHLFRERGTHRVFASVDPRNTASIALLERLGMRREAHFRESLWLGEEWVDDVVYAVLASEWLGRPSSGA